MVEAEEAAALAERAGSTLETGVDFASRTIYLVGEVDEHMVNRFLIALGILDSTTAPITIVLSSAGGDETSGYAIYDAIRLSKNWIHIIGIGAVQSIAVLIFQAGDMRMLAPQCRVMIHNGSIEMGSGVEANTLVAIGREVEKNNENYQRILAKRSGQSLATVRKLCQGEAYFSAKEAVAFGFATGIIKRGQK